MKPDSTQTTAARNSGPQGSGASACSPTALDGYKAASILIERMLNSAEKKKPLRLYRVEQKSADYRRGVYDAILTAHCWMVLGEYPEHNRKQIAEVLGSANAPGERPPGKPKTQDYAKE